MNTAQQHALEQANLITQLIKYADRTILIESASEPERRAFVKLLDDQLPDHIDILGLRASTTTTPAAIVTMVTEALQLSPGIESPQELATAAHEALTASERILVVIENAHAWLNTPQWTEMVSYLRAAHDFAPNQLLFLLTGDIGLTDQLRLEPELSEMQSDMHPCQLLGEAPPSTEQMPTEAPAATTAHSLFVEDPEDGSSFNTSDHLKPTKRFSPALLIAAGISVAVIAFGGFALLTRSTDKPAKPQTLPLTTEAPATTETPATTAPSLASNDLTQTGNPLPNDGAASTPDLQGNQITSTSSPATPPDAAPVAPQSHEAATPPPVPASKPAETVKTAEQTAAPVASEPPHLIPPKPQKPVDKPVEHVAKPVEKTSPQVKAAAPVAKATKPQPTVKHVDVKGVDNVWYRARAPKRASIQFGAFNDEKAALGFIKKHATSAHINDWHVFSQTKNNQVLYTVTAGDFATLDAARKGLTQLPSALQKLKPYPRSFGSIREVLKP